MNGWSSLAGIEFFFRLVMPKKSSERIALQTCLWIISKNFYINFQQVCPEYLK